MYADKTLRIKIISIHISNHYPNLYIVFILNYNTHTLSNTVTEKTQHYIYKLQVFLAFTSVYHNKYHNIGIKKNVIILIGRVAPSYTELETKSD